MGVSNIYWMGYSAISAQRTALEVTGENIANVNTQGYSRQQTNMVSNLAIGWGGVEVGTAVQVASVQRSYDAMLQQQTVTGNSTYQQNLARQTALTQIQPSFNELNSNGLGAAISSFFGAWQDLSGNAQGSAERQSLLSKSQVLVDNFHNVAGNLTQVAQVADQNLTGIAMDVSDMAKNLALVNTQIVATQAMGGNPNTMMDQRDLLVQKLSQKAGVTSTLQADGTATVTLAGGQTLVNGAQYATLYTQQNSATPPQNQIYLTALGQPPAAANPAVDTDVSTTVGGPNNSFVEIGGTLLVRDSIVPGYLAKMDELASNLVSAVNAQHSAGYGLDGSTGNNFFTPGGITAATISLDSSLSAAKISAAGTDPTAVGGGAGNNANAVLMAGLKDATQSFSSGNDTFAAFYSGHVSQVGMDVRSAQNATSQGEAYLKQLSALRATNSGVSLDEELTNLVRYQQAFQGAAKLLSTATEMVDTLLGMVR